MKKLTIFHLTDCPYCISAKRAVKKLQEEVPEYAAIEVEWLDENEIVSFPLWCDHYYVPSVYVKADKLYEAHPGDSDEDILRGIKNAFEAALR